MPTFTEVFAGDTGKLMMITRTTSSVRARIRSARLGEKRGQDYIVVGHDEANLGPSWQQITVFNLHPPTFNADC